MTSTAITRTRGTTCFKGKGYGEMLRMWARTAHLRDNGNAHVGHVGNDVAVLRRDAGMLKELTQVLLSHP